MSWLQPSNSEKAITVHTLLIFTQCSTYESHFCLQNLLFIGSGHRVQLSNSYSAPCCMADVKNAQWRKAFVTVANRGNAWGCKTRNDQRRDSLLMADNCCHLATAFHYHFRKVTAIQTRIIENFAVNINENIVIFY